MSSLFFSFLEVIVGGFVVWGLFNERKVALIERRFIAKMRRKGFKVIKGNKSRSHCA